MLKCNCCDLPIGECPKWTPEMDAELKAMVWANEHLAVKWCRKCDKHYGRCRCGEPDFFVVIGGKEADMSGGVRNLLGQTVVPNLKAR